MFEVSPPVATFQTFQTLKDVGRWKTWGDSKGASGWVRDSIQNRWLSLVYFTVFLRDEINLYQPTYPRDPITF